MNKFSPSLFGVNKCQEREKKSGEKKLRDERVFITPYFIYITTGMGVVFTQYLLSRCGSGYIFYPGTLTA